MYDYPTVGLKALLRKRVWQVEYNIDMPLFLLLSSPHTQKSQDELGSLQCEKVLSERSERR